MPPDYDEFAPYFDAWQDAFGGAYDELILPRVLALLARHAPRARRIADLGIGTGTLAAALARRGFTVVGVDVSRPMLAVAGRKLAAAALADQVRLVCADIRALPLAGSVDAAVCVYTVVNQLTEASDLDRLFAGVDRALAPRGALVFEVNLPAAYERFWRGEDGVDAAGARIRRRHIRRPGSTVIEASVTIETAEGAVRHDRIVQRPYEAAELEAALARHGLAVAAVEQFDPFGAGAGEPTKALWVAQRQRT
ncbi:MAG TPA: class I SAM-dependent methyltransferase [Candidatus Limnocylindria bacterium]|nr:class I SAM-dependent methyltransferase [Candidatus Limnocylindria bacterium]